MANVNVGKLLWEVAADTTKIDKSVKSSEKNVSSFGKAVTAAFSVAAIVAFSKAAIELGKKLITLSSDAEETANKFNVVFAGMEEASIAATNLAENYGISSEASERLLSDTADLLQGFGVQKDESLALSEATQQLAIDLASFSNKDPEEASRALTSALLGEREAVKSLGIAITDAELSRFAEEQGQVFSEMSKAEVAVLTLELAYKQSANAIGDFERSQASFSNQQKIMQANIADLGAEIGNSLLPAATAATTAFNNLLESILETKRAKNEFREETDRIAEAERNLGYGLDTNADRLVLLNAELAIVGPQAAQAEADLARLTEGLRQQAEAGYAASASDQRRVEGLKEKIDAVKALEKEIAILGMTIAREARYEEDQATAREHASIAAALAAEKAKKAAEDRAKSLEEYNRLEREALALRQEDADLAAERASEDAELWNQQRILIQQLRDDRKVAADEEAIREEERHAARIQNIQDELAEFSQYAGNMGTIFSNLIQIQMAGDEELSDTKKKNIIALYRIQQAANIAQITVDTAAAIMRQYKDLPIYLAIPASIITAAVGLTQAGIVAATPPPVALQDGGTIVPASPGGTSVLVGEAGQDEQIRVEPLGGSGSMVNFTVIVDREALIGPVQISLDNRDIVVRADSVEGL